MSQDPKIEENVDTTTTLEENQEPQASIDTALRAQPTTTAEGKKKSSIKDILFDTTLVLAVVALLGGGAWYTKTQFDLYRVESPLELAQQEQRTLIAECQQIQEEAFRAEAQLKLRQAVTRMETKLEAEKISLNERQENIAAMRQEIFVIQDEIRQADKSARRVARQLMPGLNIGTARTTDGQTYEDTVIREYDGRRITLRHSTGQRTKFDVNLLITDTLPPLARYAFGLDELVDMTDFVNAPGSTEPIKTSKPKAPKKSTIKTSTQGRISYEPEAGTPVLDASAPRPSTSAPINSNSDSWQPPSDPLPL